MREVGWGRLLFALGLIALGTLNFVFGDFALQWQPVPERAALAYACGALQVALGSGVLVPRTAVRSARVLLVYLVLRLEWTACFASWVIGAGVWVVADAYRGSPWLSWRRAAT